MMKRQDDAAQKPTVCPFFLHLQGKNRACGDMQRRNVCLYLRRNIGGSYTVWFRASKPIVMHILPSRMLAGPLLCQPGVHAPGPCSAAAGTRYKLSFT